MQSSKSVAKGQLLKSITYKNNNLLIDKLVILPSLLDELIK